MCFVRAVTYLLYFFCALFWELNIICVAYFLTYILNIYLFVLYAFFFNLYLYIFF